MTRTTLPTALYHVRQVGGKYIVNNLSGTLMYDAPAEDQDYDDMPATMWVVEQVGCGATPVVTIHNREYANEVFTGQLYTSSNGSIYFINHAGGYTNAVDPDNNWFGVNNFRHVDNYSFIAVTDSIALNSPYHGYRKVASQDLMYTKYYLNYNRWDEQNYYLNVGDDMFAPSTGMVSNYQLDEVILNSTTGAIEDAYGYVGAGLPQLLRTAYTLKVSDENLIDNDRTYIAFEPATENPDYYKPRHLDVINRGDAKMGQFYLKADQVNQSGEIAYILVDIRNADQITTPKADPSEAGNGWQQAHVDDGTGYLSIESLRNSANSRSSAFALVSDPRPLYHDLGETPENVKIYRQIGTAKQYLFEESNNQTGLANAIEGFGYLGITSDGVSQKQNSANSNTMAMYVQKVQRSSDNMPQYLFAVDTFSVADGFWCSVPGHGYYATSEEHQDHTVPYLGYLSGRFLINLTDSVFDGTNMLKNAEQYKHQGLTRLGFVEGIYMYDANGVERFYIVNRANTSLAELPNDGDGVINPEVFAAALAGDKSLLVLKDLSAGHNYYSFSLRYIDDNHEDMLIESNYDGVSAPGSFKGAWVQVLNGVPVLAEIETVVGDHTDENALMQQLINQAQIFRIDEDVNEQATSNDVAPEASAVVVIASEGTVTVKGAAGKKVAITNVLGQTVANTVVTSDNATISVPAGVVVVAVEGEKAVKAIVK